MSAATSAAAQGPSITVVPDDPLFADTIGLAISPNGRYIVGSTESQIGSGNYHDDLFRWDRQTGVRFSAVRTFAYGGTAVLDDGRVFASTPDIGGFQVDELARVFRWTPELNQFVYVPRPSNATTDDLFRRISIDGMYAIGMTAMPSGTTAPAIYDFSLPTPMRIDLDAGEGNVLEAFAGVTQPINGVRYAYATASGNGTRTGMSWIVSNAQPTPAPCEVYDIAPNGVVLLGKVGSTHIVRGDGADRVLGGVPGFAGMKLSRMSQDGRVVVGSTDDGTWGLSSSSTQAAVWRAGQTPATLQTILAGTGVSFPPNWFSAELTGVSADGSTVVGTYLETIPFETDLHAFSAVLPAVNDNCGTARAVPYGTIIDSTNGATRAGVSGGCFFEGSAPDVWFSFVPAANESVTIDTCGSSFDTTLTVFQGGSCGSLGAVLACNDEAAVPCAGNVHASRLSASVFAGQTYFIRVSGWNGAYGSVQMTITAPNRPANDACTQATNVPQGGGAFWNNAGAVTDARPNCAGAGTPFGDLWFRTVPLESGRMTYSTCGSTINTVMAAYPAGACGDVNMAAIACGQSNTACGGSPGTRLTIPCTAGDAQLLRVGGLFGATGSGQFTARFACDQNDLSPYAVRVVNDGARTFWRFNDSGSLTAADAVRADQYTCGNFPGEYAGGVLRVNSYHGKALLLDGTGAHVRAEAVPFGRFADPAVCPRITLEAWVKTTDPLAGVVVTSRNQPGEHSATMVVGYNPIGIANTEGRAMFISDGPGVLYGAMSSVRVDDGRWHHIVGMRTPNAVGGYTHTLYVDGVFQFNPVFGPSGTFNGSHGQYWTVGNGLAWPAAGAAFSGMIDEVAVYCGELLPSQIADHFSTGNPPPCDPIDFNGDGLFPDTTDIDDFLSVFSGGPCSTGTCADIDFNNDGLFPDTTDIDDFLRVFSGGPC
ncbi:MAG TPA: LamG-like jellyroll fold domain-containing protein [Phycisphaerales bacterium]|nr:LamG-like jellyroll fold domain-containing protein [Phycisphaerales bacterium]